MLRRAAIVIGLALAVAVARGDEPGHVVRYERDRLTVRVTEVPLDHLLGQIAAVTRATIRGSAPPRSITIDFTAVPLSEGLTRILGEESFMLTYGADGTPRTIDLLARATAASPMPSVAATPSPRPPLAEEEEQAAILQRQVAVGGPLADALGTEHVAIGQVLHAVLREPNATVRAAAREQALAAFTRDPEIETAYLSTLTPVDDTVLANVLRSTAVGDGSAEEWMAALATRAPSAALRAKAAAVMTVMQRR
jgi:hypothetical protein